MRSMGTLQEIWMALMSEQELIVSIDSEWLLAKHEQELREQIIKEIQEWQPIKPNGDNPLFIAMYNAMNQAKMDIVRHIARGQK